MDVSCRDVHDPCWSTYIDKVVAHPENYACLLDSTGTPLFTTDDDKVRRRSKRCVLSTQFYLLLKLLLQHDRAAYIKHTSQPIVAQSPWFEPQDCIWPEDEGDWRLCSAFRGAWHQCNVRYINSSNNNNLSVCLT